MDETCYYCQTPIDELEVYLMACDDCGQDHCSDCDCEPYEPED